MNRRTAIWRLAICFLATTSLAQAQQPKKIPRIGYLAITDSAIESTRAEAIRLALRERGYIDGQNITVEYRYAEGNRARLPELVAELVTLKVDIILIAGGERAIQVAKNATKTIPIVMAGLGADPVTAGLVDSLARPGGNVTGVTNLGRDLGGKRLELLKEAAPKLARVALLYASGNPNYKLELNEVLPEAARALRLTLQPWEVRGADDFDRIFAALSKQRPDGVYVLGGELLHVNQRRIIGFLTKNQLPSVHTYKEAVENGGLMSYSADHTESYRRIAYFVARSSRERIPPICRWSSQ